MTELEKERARVAEFKKRFLAEHPELAEEDKYQKHFGYYIEEEAAEVIARYEAMSDDEFPIIYEKDDGSGIVPYSREQLIERVKRNIWHGDD